VRCQEVSVTRAVQESNRHLLRARDAMDRDYAQPLDVPQLAAIAHVSPAHLSRTFGATVGETPHRHLQRHRIERAMFLLRGGDRSITEICQAVGFASLGTFSRTFRQIVQRPPTEDRVLGPLPLAPKRFGMNWRRPSSSGYAVDHGRRIACCAW
jgi:transcriptional regulator GlxA family with amidase domain